MRILTFSIFLLVFLCSTKSISQSNEKILITKTFDEFPLVNFLESLEKDRPIRFYYEKSWIEKITISGTYNKATLKQIFDKTFEGSFITYVFFDPNTVVFFSSDPKLNIAKQSNSEIEDFKLIRIGDSTKYSLLKGKEVALSGTITDGSNGEPLPGAIIHFPDLQKNAVTNAFGIYKILIPAGVHQMKIQNIGYEVERISMILYSSGKLNYELFETSTILKEFTLTEEAEDANVSSIKMGVEKIDVLNIKKLPSFLGEVDVVKSIQTLPGVSTVGEGAAGFNVRGGGTGQNLILLDNAPIYNSSHLFGFFSVFNSDIIKNIRLYKGSIPAKYGGRASSVLDIRQKDGNLKKISGSGGAGLIASRITLEAPIIKDKTSVLVSGRSSYINWILGKIRDSNLNDSQASFYDLSGRVSHSFSDKRKITASVYRNQDKFRLEEDTTFNWQNTNATIKYNQSFSDRLLAEFTGFTSNYKYKVDSKLPFNEFELSYNINSQGGNAEFEYNVDKMNLLFGASAISYQIHPGELQKGSEESDIVPEKIEVERGLETAVFADIEKNLSEKIAFSAGVRLVMFQRMGEGMSYLYKDGVPLEEGNIIDSVFLNKGEIEKRYFGAEPRFSFRYKLNQNSSVKLGYNRLQQFIHQVSNTAAVSPLAVWKLSNSHIKPQISDAIAIGYFLNLKENTIQTSIEAYFKEIKNAISYKDGAKLILNKTLETELLQGVGRAYGLELLAKKVKGRLKGQMSYTYSRTEVKFESEFDTETLSKGNFFPADYDRPHNFFLSLNYELSNRYIFGTNFTLTSGRPVTAPVSQYIINDRVVFDYSERNQFRIPTYHRLDLSLTLLTNHRKNKPWEGSWTIAIYNVYGRKNPFSVFFKPDASQIPRAYRAAILGVPFPSVTYNFKF